MEYTEKMNIQRREEEAQALANKALLARAKMQIEAKATEVIVSDFSHMANPYLGASSLYAQSRNLYTRP